MQTNIIKPVSDAPTLVEQKRECILFLISSRRAARRAIREIAEVGESIRSFRRQARKYRGSGNPVLMRNADVIDARITERKRDLAMWDELLIMIGGNIRALSENIDRLIPTSELLDILEVNPVDRSGVDATDGFREIVFVRGLEDSATYRDSDWKEGPLFEAMIRWMMHCMDTSPDLKNRITDGMFGKGGLFEFVPTYSRTTSGEFKRNPPKLRLADETDLRPGI